MGDRESQGISSAAKLAQLSAAIASIIKGALAGGLQGAAVAAVKSFLPQILKLLTFIIVMVILLPVLLFLSLTSTSFQFSSVDSPDIAEMSQKAAAVNRLYDNFGSYIRQEADGRIESLSDGYDDVVITQSLNSLNSYWLTAISSVIHQQDLDRITEPALQQMVSSGIQHSTRTETYYEEEDEDSENDEDSDNDDDEGDDNDDEQVVTEKTVSTLTSGLLA